MDPIGLDAKEPVAIHRGVLRGQAMVRVGIVGVGFMGMIHYLAYQRIAQSQQSSNQLSSTPGTTTPETTTPETTTPGTTTPGTTTGETMPQVTPGEVTAICSRDERKLAGDWTTIQGNFGPRGQLMDLGEISRHRQLDELLADPKVDLVDICLPPDLHCEVAVKALQAGKHVLVEKPIALNPDQADRMIEAAQANQKQLLVAHVLPFFPEFAYVVDLVRQGTYGALRGGIFKRVISEPTWFENLDDFFDPKKVGGPIIDLHIHDAHLIRLLCGLPRGVFSCGRLRGDAVEFLTTQFLFDDVDLSVTAISGVIPQQGRPFTHAFEIHLDQATLVFDMAGLGEGTGTPLRLLKSDGSVECPQLPAGDEIDAFAAELSEALRALNTNEPSPLLGGELARDALVMCHCQIESVKTGHLAPVS